MEGKTMTKQDRRAVKLATELLISEPELDTTDALRAVASLNSSWLLDREACLRELDRRRPDQKRRELRD